MNQVTTYETSRILAENGFPQPEPEFRQVWYLSGKPHVCIGHEGGGIYNFRSQKGMEERTAVNYPTYFFAPTATDISMAIEVELTFFSEILGWCCRVNAFGHPHYNERYFHENPAEACAEAWLKINKK